MTKSPYAMTVENCTAASELQKIGIFDASNDHSLINLVPQWMKVCCLRDRVQSLLTLQESELEQLVQPSLTLKRLRTGFWLEYDRLHNIRLTSRRGKVASLDINAICHGVCTPEYFSTTLLQNDNITAYIIRPPQDYQVAMTEALQHGVDRLREILNFPLYQPMFSAKTGEPMRDHAGEPVMKPSAESANLIIKAVAMLDLRVRGAVPLQMNVSGRIDKRNLNMNVSHSTGSPLQVDAEALERKLMSIEDIDTKIKQLSQETKVIIEDPWLGGSGTLRTNAICMETLAEDMAKNE